MDGSGEPAPPAGGGVGEDAIEDTDDENLGKKTFISNELHHARETCSDLRTGNAYGNHTSSDDTEVVQSREGKASELKKPDKILPCPRCNSMKTKFCYYNNYNVNQPRHFCKSCQRYWTAGGSMRNVPVGAGRRKSRHSSLPPRNISSCAKFQPVAPQGDAAQSDKPAGATKLAQEIPICNSMASMLKLHTQNTASVNSTKRQESQDDQPCAPSAPASEEGSRGCSEADNNGFQGCYNGVTPLHPLPCFPAVAPMLYPWSPGWNGFPFVEMPKCSSGPENASYNTSASPNPILWSPPLIPMPGQNPPAIPFPMMASPFWAFIPPWCAPCVGNNGSSSLAPNGNNTNYSDSADNRSSPTLGKHLRDMKCKGEDRSKSLVVPKTLRIDNPDEASKSSIWSTLGIEPAKRGMLTPFLSKDERRDQMSNTAKVLQANPAAFSRSQSFEEAT